MHRFLHSRNMAKQVIFICVVTFAVVLCEIKTTQPKIVYDDDLEDLPLSRSCLKCLYKVYGCVDSNKCVENVCGVMQLTQSYWAMAHQISNDPSKTPAFIKCSTNAWCAIRTVQRFMRQHLPACEQKRPDRLRCENALALHNFGSYRCHRNLTERLENKLYDCMHESTWKWLSDEN